MNVLPAPVTSTHSPATGGAPTGDDAPTGFASLLAGHVCAEGTTRVADTPVADGDERTPADVPVTEGFDAETAGAVAAAVHAAIAAWRADPADVALGAHVRHVLEHTVRAAAVAAGETPPPDPAPPPQGTVDASLEDVLPTTTVREGSDAPLPPTPDAASSSAPAPGPAPAHAEDRPDLPAPAAMETADAPRHPEAVDTRAPTPRRPSSVETGAPPAPTEAATDTSVDGPEVVVRGPSLEGPTAAPRPAGPTVASAATVDRVIRAVEALEHAPPPRRLAIEVEGVQLTVAMRGEQVSVAVRTGAEQLAPGWQRDLATALRGRGLGLATDTGTAQGGGQDRRRPPRDAGRTPPSATTTRSSRWTGPADPTSLRL